MLRRLYLLTVLFVLAACGDATGSTAPSTAASSATADPVVTTTNSSLASPTSTTAPATTTTTETAPPEGLEAAATGVVIAVDGTLTGINSFTIRLEDGTDLELVPAEGLLFDGAAPMSHVRDHLVSGAPVTVTFLDEGAAPFACIEISDASGGHSHDG